MLYEVVKQLPHSPPPPHPPKKRKKEGEKRWQTTNVDLAVCTTFGTRT
ncbi:Uncharacterised protein [Chlamydia abortus]|nr:Uncharacterised protein [Chlamydia abortus]